METMRGLATMSLATWTPFSTTVSSFSSVMGTSGDRLTGGAPAQSLRCREGKK
jgi:hypothetical protein